MASVNRFPPCDSEYPGYLRCSISHTAGYCKRAVLQNPLSWGIFQPRPWDASCTRTSRATGRELAVGRDAARSMPQVYVRGCRTPETQAVCCELSRVRRNSIRVTCGNPSTRKDTEVRNVNLGGDRACTREEAGGGSPWCPTRAPEPSRTCDKEAYGNPGTSFKGPRLATNLL